MTTTLPNHYYRDDENALARVLVAEQAQGRRNRIDDRLEDVVEQRCAWIRQYGRLGQLAVDAGQLTLTYEELDGWANRLARYLRVRGIRPGDRVGLLLDRPADIYVAMLAVLKISAAYVPLEWSDPADRMTYIVRDARISVVLTRTGNPAHAEMLASVGVESVCLDETAELISELSDSCLFPFERGREPGQLAYIIYTSARDGGRPKGVPIHHGSICNFVRVAAEVYCVLARDRIYQGQSLASDFAVEEIWVSWLAGATIVPRPAGAAPRGRELHRFLSERRVTALYTTPTVLATIEEDLPRVRFLAVSGEACPQGLVGRWYRPDRRFLNVYGPTEATVSATWSELHPDKPVTIGAPLPTYATVILDPEDPSRTLPHGEIGEIGIAGVGLACGYLNRQDITDEAFVPDFLDLPANPSGRIYRTGDLGRVNHDLEIEYLGRIDLQVEISGYRVELTEIESALLQVPGIAAAVVGGHRPDLDTIELVGYYTQCAQVAALDEDVIRAELATRLPGHLMPTHLRRLEEIPTTPQGKADRSRLPGPRQPIEFPGEIGAPVEPAEGRRAVVATGLTGSEIDDMRGQLEQLRIAHAELLEQVRLLQHPNFQPDIRPAPVRHPGSGVHTLGGCFERTCDRTPDGLAVECRSDRLTYDELDRRANRLAHLLRARGVCEGRRVGILLERSLDTYVTILGVLKAGACYVPLDLSFPDDRLSFIVQDAGLADVVTTSATAERTRELPCRVLELDTVVAELATQPESRPNAPIDPQREAYVIYTSGSTGKPKGVAISHASIVNFLEVATPIYGVTSSDRVYQGMSVSFDFHLEEMWPAWVAGAALIAGPTDARRFGQGLVDFVAEHEITVLCSVPTMLTTLESELPSVRCLLMSGEAMPPDLVRRFSRLGRRILNCYGPTETTVSSSCTELVPDRPVTLGRPFPSYVFYVMDEQLRPVVQGEIGEICIGGPGVGIGYVNRPELTAERFVPNPIAEDRPIAPRIYRSGDLGRLTPEGEYEYLGRIDTQVKIRGYRIELGEIEQAIREDVAVETAIVNPVQRDGVVQDLIGYVTLHGGPSAHDHAELRARVHAALVERLPSYMVPSFLEVLEAFPLLAADKVNRAALPEPVSAPLAAGGGRYAAPVTPREIELASAWGEVVKMPSVSAEADFFCDLGGHSLTAAQLISALRKQPGLQGLAMGDLYAHPTVRRLAEFVEQQLIPVEPEPGDAAAARPAPRRHSAVRIWSCGLSQVGLLYGWLLAVGSPPLVLLYAVLQRLGVPVPVLAIDEPGLRSAITELSGAPLGVYVGVWLAWFVLTLFLLPVLGSRIVLAGVQPGWYPLWGITYLRFWFYGKVAALSPVPLITGTPLLSPYLRLLGARVGRQCHVSGRIDLPKLVELGDGVSIGQAARVQPFVVQDGWFRLAPVRIGAGGFVGTNTVVLAGADIGDGAMVGDQSLVHADRRIPAGEYWAGSPIARQAVPAHLEGMATHADTRRWPIPVLLGYVAAVGALILLPVVIAAPSAAVVAYATLTGGIGRGMLSLLVAGPLFVVASCLVLIVARRIVRPTRTPGYYSQRSGFAVRKWLSMNVVSMSVVLTRTLYCTLYVVPFLRGLGLRFGRWSEIAIPRYIDPDMTLLGDQCFLAEGVTIAPPVYHRGWIMVTYAELSGRSFVGNLALVPGGGRMGDNSLLGVLSVAPNQPIEDETTWLGSPAIFLPRRQESQRFPDRLVYAPTPGMVIGRLIVELLRVNLPQVIIGGGVLGGFYLLVLAARTLSPLSVLALMPALGLALGLAATLLVALLKWLIIGVYRPRTEPYWSVWVRRTELITGLFESVAVPALLGRLEGTPWMAPMLRLFGVHIGRRTWLVSTGGTEFDLVHIGDDASVGEGTALQTHLFEDRVMKMSRTTVAAGASVGTNAVVLYDGQVGAGGSLDSMSLTMKGEVLPAQSHWRGIPARQTG